MTATKTTFLAELRKAVQAKGYAWAQGQAFDDAMEKYRETVEGTKNLAAIDGPSCLEAWKAIGMKGKPTYKALRALPA